MEIAIYKKVPIGNTLQNYYLTTSDSFTTNINNSVWFRPTNIKGSIVTSISNKKIHFLRNGDNFLKASINQEGNYIFNSSSDYKEPLTSSTSRKNLIFLYFPTDKNYESNISINGQLFIHDETLNQSKHFHYKLWPQYSLIIRKINNSQQIEHNFGYQKYNYTSENNHRSHSCSTTTRNTHNNIPEETFLLSKPCPLTSDRKPCGSDDGCGGSCICPDGMTCDNYGFCKQDINIICNESSLCQGSCNGKCPPGYFCNKNINGNYSCISNKENPTAVSLFKRKLRENNTKFSTFLKKTSNTKKWLWILLPLVLIIMIILLLILIFKSYKKDAKDTKIVVGDFLPSSPCSLSSSNNIKSYNVILTDIM